MIYVGLINFDDTPNKIHALISTIEYFTNTSATVVKKNSLTVCYGKLSMIHDMDDIWESDHAILMGRIFDKAQESLFKREEFRNLYHLSTKEILEKIWGKYVYINSNKEPSQFEIVVDSTGQLPFFYHPLPDGNILFSSDIEIIFKVFSQKPEYNWTYLCSYLVYGNSSAIQTPFKNIYEVPPGCCLKITKHERRTEPFWNPHSSYKTSLYQKKDAVSVLQATLKPWIEPYKNICVSLSGGLDSSSLVYCLKDIVKENQTLSAINYFHSSVKSSNELAYARRVCQETDIKLIEIDASHSLPFDAPLKKQSIKPNKPFPGLVSLNLAENVFGYLSSNSPCTFLNGNGSDSIFMRPPSKKSVADYIIEKGLKGSKEQLKNITCFYRDSLFSILKKNVISLGAYCFSWRLEKRHSKNIQDVIPHWVKQKVHQNASPDFVHPIYKHLPFQILPGKYEQIDAFFDGIASIHGEMNQVHPTFYPFFYEPVVEFAFSFPTYELFNKGYDRYPLRKAVSEHFKTETVWRRDKSQTTGIFQLGVKKNLEKILSLCLEGQFAKQGFIDRGNLYQTIMLISGGDINYMWPFMHLASVEIFFKCWEERSL